MYNWIYIGSIKSKQILYVSQYTQYILCEDTHTHKHEQCVYTVYTNNI